MRFSVLFFAVLALCSCGQNDKKPAPPAATANADTSSFVAAVPDSIVVVKDTTTKTSRPKDSVLLRFNLQKGEKYEYSMVFDILQEVQDRKMENHMDWQYQMEVIGAEGPLKIVRTTYEKVAMMMNMNGQKMDFSSENNPDPRDLMQMPSRMFKAIKGKSFDMYVRPDGNIEKVEGFDKIGEAMVAEMNLEESNKPAVLQNFRKQFNDNTVKQLFSQSFNIFPAQFVHPGDTWTKTIAAVPPSNNSTTTRYKLVSIHGDLVTLDGQTLSGMKQHSTLVVNAKTGLVMEGHIDQQMQGAKTMKGTGVIRGRRL